MKKQVYAIYAVLIAVMAAGILTGTSLAEDRPVEVKASVDEDLIVVGGRIKLDLTVINASGMQISFPEKPSNLGEFSLIKSIPVRSRLGRTADNKRIYVMSIYTTGTHVIPPVHIKYRAEGSDEWNTVLSPQIPVEVRSLLVGDETDIMDLKGIISFASALVKVVVISAGVLILAAFVFFLWRKRLREGEDEKNMALSAHEIAYDELQLLKSMNLPEQGRIKEYYTRLSDIIRHYLENRFAYRVPEMTTEEFMETLNKSDKVSDEHKKLLKDFLSHCDMVKFAKYGPTPVEIIDSFRSAENLVDQTKMEEEDLGENEE